MAINTEMVGQTFGPFVRDYTWSSSLLVVAQASMARTASNT